MNARRFLNVVHTWLLEAQGEEKVNEMLAGPMPQERSFAVLAMGGELA